MTHDQLISACTQWFWNTFPEERRMLYAINNNSYDRMEGAKNKALGVVRGVLDLCYILPKAVFYFDGKVGKDKLSDEQIDFCTKIEDRGLMWFTFSSLEEFQELIFELQNTYMI